MIRRPIFKHAPLFLSAGASCLLFSASNGAAAQIPELPTVAPVVECSTLSSVDISPAIGASAKITSAAVVDGAQSAPYCKVEVEIEGFTKSEVHMPLSGWNQRFLAGGGPGGSLQSVGFATMNRSDIGHRGNEDAFANNYKLRVDFAYRIVHLQVLASKALIAKFYGQPQKYAYYNACSEPGREGMMEVQRFPEDFNGTVTGCPPINNTVNQGLYEAWNIRTNTRADGTFIIGSDKLPLIHKAVLDECDALDGAKDGIVSDPLACHPKLTEIECKPGQDASSCLTSEQIHTALELYRGAHDDKGEKLEPFGVLPGSELQWTAVIAPPMQNGNGATSVDRRGTTFALRSEMSGGRGWLLSDQPTWAHSHSA